MSETLLVSATDIEALITEDDTPVDNMASEKQQRLLTEPLYSSWAGPDAGRLFLAAANVGIFPVPANPAIVPDMFLSLDVTTPKDWWQKSHRSYMLWEFGKPPEVAIEVVSNTIGGEADKKKTIYRRMGVTYYVIYDPELQIMPEILTIYRWRNGTYRKQASRLLPLVQLGLTLWNGVYEDRYDTWLRWTEARGALILTGKERADQERQRAEQATRQAEQATRQAEHERRRAEQAEQQAAQAHQRAQKAQEQAERLAAMLRQLGIDPQQL